MGYQVGTESRGLTGSFHISTALPLSVEWNTWTLNCLDNFFATGWLPLLVKSGSAHAMLLDTFHPKPCTGPSRYPLSEQVPQEWACAQIKNVTFLPSSSLSNVYFKIHVVSLVWKWTSVAGPDCVHLVPVTAIVDLWESAAILEGAVVTHSSSHLSNLLFFTPAIIQQSCSSVTSYSH